MPDEIRQVIKTFGEAIATIDTEGHKKKDEIAEKEKAVTEKENEVSTKFKCCEKL